MCDPSPQELERLLVAGARFAGVTIDEATALRLVPMMAGLMADWEVLVNAAPPEAEPMPGGRRPEGGHVVDRG